MIRNNRLKYALSVAGLATIAAVAPVLAASSVALNGTGDLSPDRGSAQLTVSVQCDAPANVSDTKSGALTVHIFQPSGRLLNIGIGTAPVTCDGIPVDIIVDVDAIPGLKFKPGPATAIFRLAEQTMDSSLAVTDSTITESGSKVSLRP